MAIQCTLCGTALKDDARFCNICGTLVPSHPFSPKTTAPALPPPDQSESTRRVIREQIAQQPPTRPHPGTRMGNGQPPSWMSQLESDVRTKVPSNSLPFQATETGTNTDTPDRQLRVKVWEQPPTNQLTGGVAEQARRQPLPSPSADGLEYIPTRPLGAEPPTARMQPHRPSSPPSPAPQRQETRHNDVDQLDTIPIATPKSWGAPSGTFAQGTPTVSNVNNLRQAAPSFTAEPRPRQPKQRKSRKPLGFLLVILLLLLLGGGIATWIILYAPFTVASITQPQQTLTNTQLGVSLQYPSGWTVQLDAQKSTAQLFDSSHTAQFTIVSTPSTSGDASHYLQQKATQLTMTGPKPQTTQTFAGTSWQELQGNVLINGASYTETLFAVVHQQHMYTIMQLAPQATYVQEEQYVFSSIRSSLQFVA